MSDHPDTSPDPAIERFLIASGLVAESDTPRYRPLTGGVSSDIWLVETATARFCVKRALPQLRVEAEWFAPVERSRYESAWMKGAARIQPAAVPDILAEDAASGIFAMSYLDPARYPCWKAELLAGRVDRSLAAMVGATLGKIHAGFAKDADAARTFNTDDIFHSIRLDPYLLATARAHPDLGKQLEALAERTFVTKRTVVHGDVSPKNILIGAEGPVFLDAECAWWGDPAFDLAFCLNHLLLKCLAAASAGDDLLASFDALYKFYLEHVDWEPGEDVEHRTAALLPGLLLARIDGKSPVEYIVREGDKNRVRMVARKLLIDPPDRLTTIRGEWAAAILDGTAQ